MSKSVSRTADQPSLLDAASADADEPTEAPDAAADGLSVGLDRERVQFDPEERTDRDQIVESQSAPRDDGSANLPRVYPQGSYAMVTAVSASVSEVGNGDPSEQPESMTASRQDRHDPEMPTDDQLERACIGSALWAAWADAVGFISELTSPSGMMRRLRIDRPLSASSGFAQVQELLEGPPSRWPLLTTLQWDRRVGGRGGATATLLAGTYSDDTQLRLATSRSIGPAGFSVETFASIELPVFTSYALGGGNATKGGAAAMSKAGTAWAAPGHNGWVSAGGNGVVMRVAPHAWHAAATRPAKNEHRDPRQGLDERERQSLMLDVIRNGVVTHGHPRALLPACLHALALAETIRHGSIAPIWVLHQWLDELRDVPHHMADDPVLGDQTLRSFDAESRSSFSDEWKKTTGEMHRQVERFESAAHDRDRAGSYLQAARDVGLFKKATVGVGTASFVAAYWLADAFRDDPIVGVLLAANAVGTDTDTIATIAGAHLGVTSDFTIGAALLDREYIEAETLRLIAPLHRDSAPAMTYPLLERWRAPRAQADYLGLDPNSGRVAVAGLGPGKFIAPPDTTGGSSEFAWQWFATDYGQTLLMKRRAKLETLPTEALAPVVIQGRPGEPTVGESAEIDELRARLARANKRSSGGTSKPSPKKATDLPRQASTSSASYTRDDMLRPLTFDRAMTHAKDRDFDDAVVGRLMRTLAEQQSAEVALAFVGHVLAVWRERRR